MFRISYESAELNTCLMIGFGKERFPYPGRIQWWICLRKSQMEMSSFDHMFGDFESMKKQ